MCEKVIEEEVIVVTDNSKLYLLGLLGIIPIAAICNINDIIASIIFCT